MTVTLATFTRLRYSNVPCVATGDEFVAYNIQNYRRSKHVDMDRYSTLRRRVTRGREAYRVVGVGREVKQHVVGLLA